MKFTPVFKKAAADLYTRLTLVALKLKKSVDDLELLPVACKLRDETWFCEQIKFFIYIVETTGT